MKKPKNPSKNTLQKLDGVENDPDVQFNANLLDVTGNFDDEQNDGGDCSTMQKVGTLTRPPLSNQKIKDDKNVLLLKSIYPNRPKVIFFQYPKSIQIQKPTHNRVTKVKDSASKIQLK